MTDADESVAAVRLPAVLPAAPWHRRVLQSLLYGRNVDRASKTKARRVCGLQMLRSISSQYK